MDPISIAAVVMTTLGALDSLVTGIYKGVNSKKRAAKIAEFKKAISSDVEKQRQLLEAVAKKDNALMQSLFQSIPGGDIYQSIQWERAITDKLSRKANLALTRTISENESKLANLENNNPSYATGSIDAAIKQSNWDKADKTVSKVGPIKEDLFPKNYSLKDDLGLTKSYTTIRKELFNE